jgi:hypothetical protein
MHQMSILTTQDSSVMLRSKKLEIREKSVKTERAVVSDENQKECHEIEPNPSRDRTMPVGDNSSF